jgi:sulfur-carrier protein
MPTVHFTANLQRHVAAPSMELAAPTLRALLDGVWAANPQAKSYILDEQGGLRKHVIIYIDGERVRDRTTLSDDVSACREVYVMQALSGG